MNIQYRHPGATDQGQRPPQCKNRAFPLGGNARAVMLPYRPSVTRRLLFALVGCAALAGGAQAATIMGHVVGVADGDMLTLMDADQRQHVIRLEGIDAPEKRQPFGSVAKQHLSDLAYRQAATAECRKVDRYGRQVCRVLVGAVDQPGQLGLPVAQIMFSTLATFGQYVIPVLCLFGAAASAWRRRQRSQLFANVTASPASDALEGISWQQFEHLVGEAFRLQGYRVTEIGGASADGGVDLVLSKDGEKLLVQCKQWRAFKVGVPVVRELYGVMAAEGASGGIVVTSGRFTDEAREFAQGRNVRLMDGPKLQALLQQVRGARQSAAAVHSRVEPTMATPTSAPSGIPACPLCTKPMTRRVARKGSNAGGTFWGCTGFPGCRGVKPIA